MLLRPNVKKDVDSYVAKLTSRIEDYKLLLKLPVDHLDVIIEGDGDLGKVNDPIAKRNRVRQTYPCALNS
jgi:hypothetical protein